MNVDNRRHLLWLAFCLVMILTVTGCRSHKKVIKEETKVETVNKGNKNNKKNLRDRITDEALEWVGTPYKYAGSDKGKGTDCSGLVVTVYEQICGIKLPRNSAQQAEFCKTLKKNSIKPGDLVFFATGNDKKKVSHVGIMIDEGRFVHASGSKGVIISEMNTPYYERTFTNYGRVPGLE